MIERGKECSEIIEMDLGTRSLNRQGKHNKTIVVPKIAIENCGVLDPTKMRVSLVQTNKGEKFIKLTHPNETINKDKIINFFQFFNRIFHVIGNSG